MPRSRRIFWIAGGAIFLASLVGLLLATRDTATDDIDRSRARTPARSDRAGGPSASSGDRAPASGSSARDAPPAADLPLEAMPQLAEAFRSAHYEDAVELCAAPATLAAHRSDCTIAACRAHLEARARGWFAGVAADDRARVVSECQAAQVTLGHIRPHGRPRRNGDLD